MFKLLTLYRKEYGTYIQIVFYRSKPEKLTSETWRLWGREALEVSRSREGGGFPKYGNTHRWKITSIRPAIALITPSSPVPRPTHCKRSQANPGITLQSRTVIDI